MKAYSPVRFPVRLADIFRAVVARKPPSPGREFFSSGRMALAVALRCLADDQDPARREVIIPDFICTSVSQAVVAAGFTPVFCALKPETWFYDLAELKKSIHDRTAAVVVVYFFGQKPDLNNHQWNLVEELLEDVAVIEDLAQAYGFDHRESDPFVSAFRIASFGPGKSLPMGCGGVIEVVDPDLADRLSSISRAVNQQGTFSGLINLTRCWVQSQILHPSLWPFFWRLADKFYHTAEVGEWQEGARLSSRAATYVFCAEHTLQREIDTRRRNAIWLRQHLDQLDALTMPSEENLERGVCLRFPIVLSNQAETKEVLRRLHAEKILVGGGDWADFGGARPSAIDLGHRVVALPTHSESESIRAKIVDVFYETLGTRKHEKVA